jgi:hypothetical protein
METRGAIRREFNKDHAYDDKTDDTFIGLKKQVSF